jgi:hypothetical protein
MAAPALARAPAPALARAPASEIEVLIGDVTAAAAAALAQALTEHWSDGGLSKKTKKTGGDWIADLWKLQQATRGELADFEQVAREQGRLALQKRCNGGYHTVAAKSDILVDEVLKILDQVTETMRSTMN